MVDEGERIPDLLRPFLQALPISGASLTVISASGHQSSLYSTDAVSARLDELQYELGEGPQRVAASTGNLIVISDTETDGADRWPVFGVALRQLPVRALFAVPLRMGAVTVGVATLYRERPGDLHDDQRESALAIASAIASTAVQRVMTAAADDAPVESQGEPALRREVHQATGMLIIQLGTTATVAYARLQAYAFASGRTIQAVAHDVVTGALSFDENTP